MIFIPEIPNNSLKKKLEEIVFLAKTAVDSEAYEEELLTFEFNPPASEDEINKLEADLDIVFEEDYKDQLEEERVTIADYDSDMIYKKYLNIFDNDLVTYLKHKPRKIITIVGAKKFNSEIFKKYSDLCLLGNIVFTSVIDSDDVKEDEQILLDELIEDELLISDSLYVFNKDKYIGKTIQKYIDYAKQHNKEIEYLENI